MSDYVLFMADVENSTTLTESRHRAVFKAIDGAITELNKSVEAVLPLSRQYGDEVSGLFSHAQDAYRIATRLRDAVHPSSGFRFVVVQGSIGQMDRDITKVGGKIFKHANELMARAKAESRYGLWSCDPAYDHALNALTAASAYIWKAMTPYQWEIYQLRRKGWSYKKIEVTLKKKQQSVSKAARRGGADLVIETETAIDQLLTQLNKG